MLLLCVVQVQQARQRRLAADVRLWRKNARLLKGWAKLQAVLDTCRAAEAFWEWR